MKKLLKVLIICTLFVSFVSSDIFAFPAADHNKFYHEVLFGENTELNKNQKELLKLLDAASAIAIDHYKSSDNKSNLETLKKNNVKYLPENINEISYENKGVSAGDHREYTHLGWDNQISELENRGKEDLAKFETRKKLLMSTVNKVLNFSVFSDFSFLFIKFNFDKKCESFAAFTYYIHILDDYIQHEEYVKQVTHLIPFSTRTSDNSPTLISELKKHIEILFEDQKDNSKEYKKLIDELDKIEKKSARYCGLECKNLQKNYTNINDQANDLKKILIKYIPNLLENEKFFNKVFY